MNESANPLQSLQGSAENGFYVGYLPLPWRHSKFLRVAIPLVLWFMAAAAFVVAWKQNDPGTAVWDTGMVRTWEGWIVASPYPMLMTSGSSGVESFMLVNQGKHGAQGRIAGLDGRHVRVEGWLLERDGRRMIEVAAEPGAIAETPATADAPTRAFENRGHVRLSGEIMDAKCFLGAMKPGEGFTHRACAILCITGGIPPMLVTREAEGRASYFLLTDAADHGLGIEQLPAVAEPVVLEGELRRRGDVWYLAIQTARIAQQPVDRSTSNTVR